MFIVNNIVEAIEKVKANGFNYLVWDFDSSLTQKEKGEIAKELELRGFEIDLVSNEIFLHTNTVYITW